MKIILYFSLSPGFFLFEPTLKNNRKKKKENNKTQQFLFKTNKQKKKPPLKLKIFFTIFKISVIYSH